jgi:beta-barrel assembly-enhancing protease
MAPQLEKLHDGVSTDPELTGYITEVGQKLLPFSLRSDFPHTFKVLNSTKIMNAFSLGNGNVYITKALLGLIGDEAELAEVLGHENGHIGHRHIASAIDASIGTAGLMALATSVFAAVKGNAISADDQAKIDEANKVVPSLLLNGFSREHELEADQHGLSTMVQAGYDPQGSLRTFQKLQKLEPTNAAAQAYMSTHPIAKTRISDLKASIDSQYPGVTGVTNQDRYQQVVNGKVPIADVASSLNLLAPPSSVSPILVGGVAVGLVGAITILLISLS